MAHLDLSLTDPATDQPTTLPCGSPGHAPAATANDATVPDPLDGRPAAPPPAGLERMPSEDPRTAPRLVAVGPGRVVEPESSDQAPPQRNYEQRPLLVPRAKVTPPPVRDDVLARQRLFDWLDERIHRRVIVISAESGYGKTTLLADYARRSPVRFLWYRLETSDRDWVTFISHLVAAGRESEPAFGMRTESLLSGLPDGGVSRDGVVTAFVAELESLGGRPTAIVLDDLQAVDEDAGIREIITRLLAHAPDRLTFVLMGRRRPSLPLARLSMQGDTAEMTSADLRFSVKETERLFRDAYHLPLDGDLLAQVDARTRGWPASLSLLRASIQDRAPEEIRSLVASLSGAAEPLYDFLAEEVIDGLPSGLQRFLCLTSILRPVDASLALALFPESDEIGSEQVTAWLGEAERAGLLSRRSVSDPRFDCHPLLREFLQRRLAEIVDDAHLRAVHLRVARRAEEMDWLVAGRHFLAAGDRAEARRVISQNAAAALGTGSWGRAAELIRAADASDADPAIAVLLAREDVYDSRLDLALDRLDRIDITALDDHARALVLQGRVHALWWRGEMERVLTEVAAIADDVSLPTSSRRLAAAAHAAISTALDGALPPAHQLLAALVAEHEDEGRWFYAGVSASNLAFVDVIAGDFDSAAASARRALHAFEYVSPPPEEALIARIGLARALAERGEIAAAQVEAEFACVVTGAACAERMLEVAALLPEVVGTDRASWLLERALDIDGSVRDRCSSHWTLAKSRVLMSHWQIRDAEETLGHSYAGGAAATPGTWLHWMCLRAILGSMDGDRDTAMHWIRTGQSLATRQGARLYSERFRLLEAVLEPRSHWAAETIATCSEMDMLACAEAIVSQLGEFDAVPARVVDSVRRCPARWRPLLRAALSVPSHPRSVPAANLLDQHGEISDVRLLRALSRTRVKGLKGTNLGRGLARRLSPGLFVVDLGPSALEIGQRRVELTSIRRKAASVLCFALARPSFLSTKDQVLDAIWPDLDPAAALNSLNQTLYFLRRDIDPAYDDEASAQYVRFEGDLLWLDRNLVGSASSRFDDLCAGALAHGGMDIQVGLEALATYSGRFAPEFEYEEWSIATRDRLHAQYLHVAELVEKGLAQQGSLQAAASVAARVLAIDPSAESVERELIWLYGQVGSRSAASEQYAHYASTQRRDGIEPPRLEDILAGGVRNPTY